MSISFFLVTNDAKELERALMSLNIELFSFFSFLFALFVLLCAGLIRSNEEVKERDEWEAPRKGYITGDGRGELIATISEEAAEERRRTNELSIGEHGCPVLFGSNLYTSAISFSSRASFSFSSSTNTCSLDRSISIRAAAAAAALLLFHPAR